MNNKIVKVVHGDTGNLDYLKKLYEHILINVRKTIKKTAK